MKQVITHAQTPSPSSVGQNDDQFMIYEHNAYYTSPYKVCFLAWFFFPRNENVTYPISPNYKLHTDAQKMKGKREN